MHTYTRSQVHTPTLRCTYQALYTHMNAPPHAHMPCVQTCTHSRVCTHTLPSPGQRAGLARRRQTEVVAELCFPTVPCFWLEGRGSPGTAQEGQPWPSSRPRAHTLLPSSRSVRGHLMLCCPRCHSGGPLEPPSHMWGTPASPAAPTPAGPAPWPHGPSELPGHHRVL